jgi:hypothetical protein
MRVGILARDKEVILPFYIGKHLVSSCEHSHANNPKNKPTFIVPLCGLFLTCRGENIHSYI